MLGSAPPSSHHLLRSRPRSEHPTSAVQTECLSPRVSPSSSLHLSHRLLRSRLEIHRAKTRSRSNQPKPAPTCRPRRRRCCSGCSGCSGLQGRRPARSIRHSGPSTAGPPADFTGEILPRRRQTSPLPPPQLRSSTTTPAGLGVVGDGRRRERERERGV